MSVVIDAAAQRYQAMPAASEESGARPGDSSTGAVDVVSMLLSCFEKQLPERLMGNALALLRLLHAVDTVPQGGLYEGYYAYSAFQRYRMYWLPLLRAACYDGPHPQDRPCPMPPQAAAASQRSHSRVNGSMGPGASNRAQHSAGAGSARGRGPSHVLLKLPQPPLDVQWMWFLHRCAPDAYERDLNVACAVVTAATAAAAVGARPPSQRHTPSNHHPPAHQHHQYGSMTMPAAAWEEEAAEQPPGGNITTTLAFRSCSSPPHPTQQLWGSLFADAPQPFWPPPPPGSAADVTAAGGPAVLSYDGAYGMECAAEVTADLLSLSQLLGGLLHSLLRPEYIQRGAMRQARARYAKWWVLALIHDDEVLVPPADVALFWCAHMAMAGWYRRACRAFAQGGGGADAGAEAGPGAGGAHSGVQGSSGAGGTVLLGPAHLRLDGEEWARAYARSKYLYEATYAELFDPPHTQYVPLSLPHPLAQPSSLLSPLLPAFDQHHCRRQPQPLTHTPSQQKQDQHPYQQHRRSRDQQHPHAHPRQQLIQRPEQLGVTPGPQPHSVHDPEPWPLRRLVLPLGPDGTAGPNGADGLAAAPTPLLHSPELPLVGRWQRSGSVPTAAAAARAVSGSPASGHMAAAAAAHGHGGGGGGPDSLRMLALSHSIQGAGDGAGAGAGLGLGTSPQHATAAGGTGAYTQGSTALSQIPSQLWMAGASEDLEGGGGAPGPGPGPGCREVVVRQPRCGAHALFVAWRMTRGIGDESHRVGVFQEQGCCGCSPGQFTMEWSDRRPANRLTNFIKLREAWASFRGLPHDASHPYLVAVSTLRDDFASAAEFGAVHTPPWAAAARRHSDGGGSGSGDGGGGAADDVGYYDSDAAEAPDSDGEGNGKGLLPAAAEGSTGERPGGRRPQRSAGSLGSGITSAVGSKTGTPGRRVGGGGGGGMGVQERLLSDGEGGERGVADGGPPGGQRRRSLVEQLGDIVSRSASSLRSVGSGSGGGKGRRQGSGGEGYGSVDGDAVRTPVRPAPAAITEEVWREAGRRALLPGADQRSDSASHSPGRDGNRDRDRDRERQAVSPLGRSGGSIVSPRGSAGTPNAVGRQLGSRPPHLDLNGFAPHSNADVEVGGAAVATPAGALGGGGGGYGTPRGHRRPHGAAGASAAAAAGEGGWAPWAAPVISPGPGTIARGPGGAAPWHEPGPGQGRSRDGRGRQEGDAAAVAAAAAAAMALMLENERQGVGAPQRRRNLIQAAIAAARSQSHLLHSTPPSAAASRRKLHLSRSLRDPARPRRGAGAAGRGLLSPNGASGDGAEGGGTPACRPSGGRKSWSARALFASFKSRREVQRPAEVQMPGVGHGAGPGEAGASGLPVASNAALSDSDSDAELDMRNGVVSYAHMAGGAGGADGHGGSRDGGGGGGGGDQPGPGGDGGGGSGGGFTVHAGLVHLEEAGEGAGLEDGEEKGQEEDAEGAGVQRAQGGLVDAGEALVAALVVHPYDRLPGFTPGAGRTADGDAERLLPAVRDWAARLRELQELQEEYGSMVATRVRQVGGAAAEDDGQAAALAADARTVPRSIWFKAQCYAWARAFCWHPCLAPATRAWKGMEPQSRRTLLCCTFVVPLMPLLALLIGGVVVVAAAVLALPLAIMGLFAVSAEIADDGCGACVRQRMCCLVEYQGPPDASARHLVVDEEAAVLPQPMPSIAVHTYSDSASTQAAVPLAPLLAAARPTATTMTRGSDSPADSAAHASYSSHPQRQQPQTYTPPQQQQITKSNAAAATSTAASALAPASVRHTDPGAPGSLPHPLPGTQQLLASVQQSHSYTLGAAATPPRPPAAVAASASASAATKPTVSAVAAAPSLPPSPPPPHPGGTASPPLPASVRSASSTNGTYTRSNLGGAASGGPPVQEPYRTSLVGAARLRELPGAEVLARTGELPRPDSITAPAGTILAGPAATAAVARVSAAGSDIGGSGIAEPTSDVAAEAASKERTPDGFGGPESDTAGMAAAAAAGAVAEVPVVRPNAAVAAPGDEGCDADDKATLASDDAGADGGVNKYMVSPSAAAAMAATPSSLTPRTDPRAPARANRSVAAGAATPTTPPIGSAVAKGAATGGAAAGAAAEAQRAAVTTPTAARASRIPVAMPTSSKAAAAASSAHAPATAATSTTVKTPVSKRIPATATTTAPTVPSAARAAARSGSGAKPASQHATATAAATATTAAAAAAPKGDTRASTTRRTSAAGATAASASKAGRASATSAATGAAAAAASAAATTATAAAAPSKGSTASAKAAATSKASAVGSMAAASRSKATVSSSKASAVIAASSATAATVSKSAAGRSVPAAALAARGATAGVVGSAGASASASAAVDSLESPVSAPRVSAFGMAAAQLAAAVEDETDTDIDMTASVRQLVKSPGGQQPAGKEQLGWQESEEGIREENARLKEQLRAEWQRRASLEQQYGQERYDRGQPYDASESDSHSSSYHRTRQPPSIPRNPAVGLQQPFMSAPPPATSDRAGQVPYSTLPPSYSADAGSAAHRVSPGGGQYQVPAANATAAANAISQQAATINVVVNLVNVPPPPPPPAGLYGGGMGHSGPPPMPGYGVPPSPSRGPVLRPSRSRRMSSGYESAGSIHGGAGGLAFRWSHGHSPSASPHPSHHPALHGNASGGGGGGIDLQAAATAVFAASRARRNSASERYSGGGGGGRDAKRTSYNGPTGQGVPAGGGMYGSALVMSPTLLSRRASMSSLKDAAGAGGPGGYGAGGGGPHSPWRHAPELTQQRSFGHESSSFAQHSSQPPVYYGASPAPYPYVQYGSPSPQVIHVASPRLPSPSAAPPHLPPQPTGSGAPSTRASPRQRPPAIIPPPPLWYEPHAAPQQYYQPTMPRSRSMPHWDTGGSNCNSPRHSTAAHYQQQQYQLHHPPPIITSPIHHASSTTAWAGQPSPGRGDPAGAANFFGNDLGPGTPTGRVSRVNSTGLPNASGLVRQVSLGSAGGSTVNAPQVYGMYGAPRHAVPESFPGEYGTAESTDGLAAVANAAAAAAAVAAASGQPAGLGGPPLPFAVPAIMTLRQRRPSDGASSGANTPLAGHPGLSATPGRPPLPPGWFNSPRRRPAHHEYDTPVASGSALAPSASGEGPYASPLAGGSPGQAQY